MQQSKLKSKLKQVKLYVIENKSAFAVLLVLALFMVLFLLTFYNFNSRYLYEINHGNHTQFSSITNRLFYTYFNVILYTAIYLVCSVMLFGKKLYGQNDYRPVLILWYLILFLFTKINDINVCITPFQQFINLISDSLYELSTIPLLLYVVLKMKVHTKYMQIILLFECLTSVIYVVGHNASPSSFLSIFQNVGCSSIFIITVLVIHTFSVIEIKHKNVELRNYILVESAVIILYGTVCIFASIFQNEFFVILENGVNELIKNFDIMPLRKAVLQEVIAISVFLNYFSIAFRQYISQVERNKSIETELLISESYNEISQVRIREVRKLKHDIKEHINVAYMYLKSEEYDKLNQYLKELGAETESLPPLAYCNNISCNHILVYYSEKAKKSNIRFTVNASTGENIGISDSEATSLLSNILKNAYEACIAYVNEGNANPYINFSMHIKNSKIYISCENSCLTGATKGKNGRFKTTKQNAERHGLGTAIVESICENHNGAAVFEIVGNKFLANATIPVNLS